VSGRNPRNNPYLPVEPLIGVSMTAPVTVLWRWRTEIALACLPVAVAVAAATGTGPWWPLFALGGAVTAPVSVPAGRKWLTAHFWCLFSRHRLQRVCRETSMHTRHGRIPLILWITPTTGGEKAFVLLRAGISVADFEAFADEIAAACCASHVRVSRHPGRAQFVTVEILRREELLEPGLPGGGLARDRAGGR
jgi:hypothetical protein